MWTFVFVVFVTLLFKPYQSSAVAVGTAAVSKGMSFPQ